MLNMRGAQKLTGRLHKGIEQGRGVYAGVVAEDVEVEGIGQHQPDDVGDHQLACQPVHPPETVGGQACGHQQRYTSKPLKDLFGGAFLGRDGRGRPVR